MERICIAVTVMAALALTSRASAGNAYDNQIEMTATLVAGSPAGFRELCNALDGTHSEAGTQAKCIRE